MNHQYRHIRSYPQYLEANIALGALEAQDIDCWLRDETTVSVTPYLGQAVGGIKLMVAAHHVADALAILQANERPPDGQVCSRCGSPDAQVMSSHKSTTNWITAIAGYLFGGYAIAPDKRWHCFVCGHEWEVEGEEG